MVPSRSRPRCGVISWTGIVHKCIFDDEHGPWKSRSGDRWSLRVTAGSSGMRARQAGSYDDAVRAPGAGKDQRRHDSRSTAPPSKVTLRLRSLANAPIGTLLK